MTTWTVETVKRDLPDVPVRWNVHRRDVLMAHVSGRRNPFATVWWLRPDNGHPEVFTVAWSTIRDVLNDGRTVLA